MNPLALNSSTKSRGRASTEVSSAAHLPSPTSSIVSTYPEARETGANKHFSATKTRRSSAGPQHSRSSTRNYQPHTEDLLRPPHPCGASLRHNEFCWTKLPGSIAIPG